MSPRAWAERNSRWSSIAPCLKTVEFIAERIRASFATRLIETETRPLSCTVSAGFAFGSEGGTKFDKVLSAADKALYDAKRGGRNRVLAFRRAG